MRAMARIVACGALTLLLVASLARAADDAEAKVVAAAKSWLALVDAGSYGPSWDAAASMFKSAVTKVDWERMVAGARGSFGKLLTRELTSTKAVTSLPGAPDGHYVVMQFKTAFERKAQAVETVTAVFEKDGVWRVTGYFIR